MRFDTTAIDNTNKISYNTTMNILPRYKEAIIPIKKFKQYALNHDKDFDKATAFNLALGYNLSNVDELIQNIKSNLPNFSCKEKGDIGFGMRYEVIMLLVGANGKTANVLTAWIDDKDSAEMRLTNAYIDKRRKLNND